MWNRTAQLEDEGSAAISGFREEQLRAENLWLWERLERMAREVWRGRAFRALRCNCALCRDGADSEAAH